MVYLPSMTIKKLDIFQFKSAGAFLTETYRLSKIQKKKVTLKQWAKNCGFKSPRALGMVFTGERLPSLNVVNSVSKILKFNHREHSYFVLLSERDRKQKQKKSTFEIDMQLTEMQTKVNVVPVNCTLTGQIVGDWYHLVIRQLAGKNGIQNDPAKISKLLKGKVTATEIRFGIDRMLKAGLLKIDAQGVLRITDDGLNFQSDVPSTAIQLHHLQMLDRAKESIKEVDVAQREFNSLTISMASQDLVAAKEMLRAFHAEFNKKFHR